MNRKTSFYVTYRIKDMMDRVLTYEEIPKTLLIKRSIRHYLDGDKSLDPDLANTSRSDPEYIPRSELINSKVDVDQYNRLKAYAEKFGCSTSTLINQALLDFCKMRMDEDGIESAAYDADHNAAPNSAPSDGATEGPDPSAE